MHGVIRIGLDGGLYEVFGLFFADWLVSWIILAIFAVGYEEKFCIYGKQYGEVVG